eukprot:TRINITY_DN71279_c0_g1_i1.p1 TRINITY_DN71279_c0_g1~~TRINITY_DN71279_c0_g1_i1.p1  ORF type:complete len:185 (-),score=11.92 TRINITY_DN71279_c0_g1_i1:122-676(-)
MWPSLVVLIDALVAFARRSFGGLADVWSPALGPTPVEGNISYVHLWVSADGETHLADCLVQGLVSKKLPGGQSVQYVQNLFDVVPGLNSTNVIVTQQVGPNPWHHCPQTQFVVTLSGTWFVKATDGSQRHLPPGTWLFQDDTSKHPAAKNGTRRAMHYSEAEGPCNQMVLQWKKEPVIGHPCPF